MATSFKRLLREIVQEVFDWSAEPDSLKLAHVAKAQLNAPESEVPDKPREFWVAGLPGGERIPLPGVIRRGCR